MKFDMMSLGPARMDAFVALPEGDIREVCNIDRQRCVIELGFGDKIPVRSVEFAVGGNTGNNAVGLARLGYKVAMAGTMGGEWVDMRALEVLREEGVDVENMTTVPGKFGFGVIIGYQGERTILSYYPDSECVFKLGEKDVRAEWVYLTTAGQDYGCFYEDAVEWARKVGARIAFNPGSRQIRDGVEKLRYAYKATEVIFVNREEAAKLLGRYPGDDIKVLLSGMRGLGPKLAVVTDGPEGAYAYDGTKHLFMPSVPAPVVERTGAGDAFGSGFLAAYMKGMGVGEALKWGACNSASVLGWVGPQAGLLKKEEMEEWLEKAQGVKVEQV